MKRSAEELAQELYIQSCWTAVFDEKTMDMDVSLATTPPPPWHLQSDKIRTEYIRKAKELMALLD